METVHKPAGTERKRLRLNTRLSKHILTYSDWYDSATIERAKADLKNV
ncbi:hypothetical protein J26TS2_36810 [Shouchella clausii]|nr:hypothetical protein [Shouchella tritolerans]GIN13814.1 hypothetical protein J26TS2_36810 [Shouchella clausii]